MFQHRIGLAIMVLCGVVRVTSAGTDTQTLIQQLGSPRFQSRIDAERELLNLGIESLPSVHAASRSDNPEIRFRSQRVLELLQRSSITNSYPRIESDPWTVSEAIAPGWEAFFSMLGDSKPARKLYVEMLRSEPALMLKLSDSDWQPEFERRCADVNSFSGFRYRMDSSVGSMATLLFLACHPDNEPSGQATAVIYYYLDDLSFRNATKTPETGSILKSLISHWILKSQGASDTQKLQLAVSYELPEGLDAARELLRQRKQDQSSTNTANAIFYLAMYGGDESFQELEGLLEDETKIPGVDRNGMDTQVRDIALVGLLHLTGQDPADYGLANLRARSGLLYIASSIRFESEQAREQAFKRWQEWRAANYREILPEARDAVEGIEV